MDTRTHALTYEESRLDAEIAMTDALRRAVARIPHSHPDITAQDIALGVAIRTYGSPLGEDRRKFLSLFRQMEHTTDPDEEADLCEQLQMLAYGWRRAAEERANERDPITGKRVTL